MRKHYGAAGIIIAISLIIPSLTLAAGNTVKQKTVTGVVSRIVGNQLIFRTTTAALYSAETSGASLVRKYGTAMRFDEILLGDKVEVKGMVWPDNSINASQVRDMSLYVHNGTVTGKIETINPLSLSFTMLNSSLGLLSVVSNSYTIFKKNTVASSLSELEPGITVSVKGMWERDKTQIVAKQVSANVRLVNIEISGQIMLTDPTGFSVLANGNVLYGVNLVGSKLQNKNNQPLAVSQFLAGQTVKVQGKHISGKNQITASLIKNLSLPK